MTVVIWNPGNILFPLPNGVIRVYQPHYRRNVLISMKACHEFIDALVSAKQEGIGIADAAKLWKSEWSMIDASTFTLYDHAYANSAMFDEDVKLSDAEPISGEDVITYLTDAGFLASQWPIEYDHEKKGFADRFKGSFYEQIGTECLLERRIPTEWWMAQKFESDRLKTRENPYHYIQDRYLDSYLEETVSGKSIIEIGCGTGYYTNRMAQVAGEAVGIDYNPEYVEIAKTTWEGHGDKNAEYVVCDIIDFKADKPEFIDKQYDRVILIDTFLFLFHETYQPELYNNRMQILKNMSRLVKPDGRILIMDPHPFFLTPYFGDPNRPFGIMESYNNHHFRVIPTFEEISSLFCEADLSIRRVLEPKPHADFHDVDPIANKFYNELPTWWLFELQPVK